MDREEAIGHLKNIAIYSVQDGYTDEARQALDIAIEALQAQTDGDLISRQALCQYALNQKDKGVTPNDIMRFPSAEPKTGEWIMQNEELKISDYRCSECGHYQDDKTDFCPNCGADMRGEKHE